MELKRAEPHYTTQREKDNVKDLIEHCMTCCVLSPKRRKENGHNTYLKCFMLTTQLTTNQQVIHHMNSCLVRRPVDFLLGRPQEELMFWLAKD